MPPAADLGASIVGAGNPANVETVKVDGHVVKHDGHLVSVNLSGIQSRAKQFRDRLFATPAKTGDRAGWPHGRLLVVALLVAVGGVRARAPMSAVVQTGTSGGLRNRHEPV